MLFRSEDEIEEWLRSKSRERGAVLKLEKVWELSKLWYHDRMSASFRGKTITSALEIFRSLELTDDFWTIPPC